MGKHQGARETSISLAGSHMPSASPIRGIGEPQKQIGEPGLGVSGAPVALPMEIGPIEIGNRHSQHTSAIGLTNRPVQDCAKAVPAGTAASITIASSRIMRCFIVRTPVRRGAGTP